MSDPQPAPVEPNVARLRSGPTAAILPFPRRVPRVELRDSQPVTPAPRAAARREHKGSLYAPAPRASVALAAALAVVCAIAGVVVALSLGGAFDGFDALDATPLEFDASAATPLEPTPRVVVTPHARSAWHLGWGAALPAHETAQALPVVRVAADVMRAPRKRANRAKREEPTAFLRIFTDHTGQR